MFAWIAVSLDVLIGILVALSLVVIVSGGGDFEILGAPIKARRAGALVDIAFALTLLRAVALQRFRGLPHIAGDWIARIAAGSGLGSAGPSGAAGPSRPVWPLLLGLAALSLAIKTMNAIGSEGFFSGDDVEVLERAFAGVRDLPYESWELRSSFYPSAFLQPWLAIAASWGATTSQMIIAGRLVVASWSLLAIPLVYLLASRFVADRSYARATGVAAAAFLVLNGAETAFASSVLPRSIAGVFALASACLLSSRRTLPIAVACLTLGAATALRFSEVFLLPAAFCFLLIQRRYLQALAVPLLGALVAVGIWSAFDILDGNAPLTSLRAVVQYTLVDGNSSRGVQPWYHYFASVPVWLGLPATVCVLLAAHRRHLAHSMWLLVPLLLLSALPHKETRYVVPYLGFAVAFAGLGLVRWLAWLRPGTDSARSRGRWAGMGVFATVVVFAFLYGADGQRFHRSDGAVRAARYVEAQGGTGTVLVQQSWKAGGQLYFRGRPRSVDLDAGQLRRRDTTELVERLDAHSYAYVIVQSKVAAQTETHAALHDRGYSSLPGPWEHDLDPHALYVYSR